MRKGTLFSLIVLSSSTLYSTEQSSNQNFIDLAYTRGSDAISPLNKSENLDYLSGHSMKLNVNTSDSFFIDAQQIKLKSGRSPNANKESSQLIHLGYRFSNFFIVTPFIKAGRLSYKKQSNMFSSNLKAKALTLGFDAQVIEPVTVNFEYSHLNFDRARGSDSTYSVSVNYSFSNRVGVFAKHQVLFDNDLAAVGVRVSF